MRKCNSFLSLMVINIVNKRKEFRTFYLRNKSSIAGSQRVNHSRVMSSKNKLDSGSNIVPVISYTNANTDKSIIYANNKGKSGIYRWNNLVTGRSYIGSSINLTGRFSNYYSTTYLNKRVEKGSSIIYSSILKHGYCNFSLDILEYCEPNLLISREQYYIDCLKPKYNILTTAGSRLGSIQSQETRQYISKVLINRVFSDESRDKMKIAAKHRLGDKTSFFGKTHNIATKNKISLTKYVPVKVTNVKTNNITIFASNKDAAEYLRIGESTLRKYKKQAKLLLGKYLITNDIKKP